MRRTIPALLLIVTVMNPSCPLAQGTAPAIGRAVPTVDVLKFGAKCDGASDDKAAFENALAALPRNGGALRVPAGTCFLSSTLNLTKPVHLIGEMHSATNNLPDSPGTVLLFGRDSDGIIVNRHDTFGRSQVAAGTYPGADDSSIEYLLVLSSGGMAAVHGITLRARASIRNVNVRNFSGDCIRIVATEKAQGELHGNANNWFIEKVRTVNCGGNGLYLDGGDVNAGVAISLDSSGNKGWGIFDSGFLGSTYVGAHAEDNGLGPYKTDNPNARHVFVGCYSEPGQPPSSLISPTLVIGGLHGAGFSSNSTHSFLTSNGWEGQRGFVVQPRTNGTKPPIATSIGGATNEFLGVTAEGDKQPSVQFRYEGGSFDFRTSNSPKTRAQIITTSGNSGKIVQVTVINGGTGYKSAKVSFVQGGGSNATAVAKIAGGAVKEIHVESGGSGFITPPKVLIEGDGSGAEATAIISQRIMAGRAVPLPASSVIFPGGFFLGGGSSPSTGRMQTNAVAMPTDGTFAQGDFVWKRDPMENGKAGTRYVTLGWIRITNGNSHRPNVDWIEARVLTGN